MKEYHGYIAKGSLQAHTTLSFPDETVYKRYTCRPYQLCKRSSEIEAPYINIFSLFIAFEDKEKKERQKIGEKKLKKKGN